jgi:O6-methylguanine-DNA--protein-cysteine methyltransferase
VIEPRTTSPEHQRIKAQHLRQVAARWQAELQQLKMRKRGQDRRMAVAGALELARELGQEAGQQVDLPLPQRVVELRRQGLPFTAVARTLGIPTGSAKTYARQARLAGHPHPQPQNAGAA